jgi:hypothetical protein
VSDRHIRFLDAALVAFFLFLVTLLCLLPGCATTAGVIKTCKPSTTDEQQAIVDLFSRFDLTTAEVIATAEASKIAVCVVTEIAKNLLGVASTAEALTSSSVDRNVAILRAEAWLQKHP